MGNMIYERKMKSLLVWMLSVIAYGDNKNTTTQEESTSTAIVENTEEIANDIDTTSYDNMSSKEKNATLIEVSVNGDLESVKSLIENSADINTKDYQGNTALMIASEEGHAEIVELLKKAGAIK